MNDSHIHLTGVLDFGEGSPHRIDRAPATLTLTPEGVYRIEIPAKSMYLLSRKEIK